MPMRIRDWLRDVVSDPNYGNHVWWSDERKNLIAIHWKHASYDDYNNEDSALFRKWALDNNRYDHDAADSRDERKRWKTNFRCALHSATNIRKRSPKCLARNDKQLFRVYELLEYPDPQKVVQKKKSNELAARSKQKSSDEKRVYRSRLNKSKTVVKLEPKERERCQRRSQDMETNRDTLREVENRLHATATTQMYTAPWSGKPSSQPTTSSKDLPATLEEFNNENERDDGGYYSASDSMDSNMSGQAADHDNDSSRTPSRLEPVESLFHRQYYTVGPLPTTEHEMADYLPCDSNVYMNHNSQVYEISSTPNVCTEMFPEQDVFIPTAVQYSSSPDGFADGSYCLTAL